MFRFRIPYSLINKKNPVLASGADYLAIRNKGLCFTYTVNLLGSPVNEVENLVSDASYLIIKINALHFPYNLI